MIHDGLLIAAIVVFVVETLRVKSLIAAGLGLLSAALLLG